MPRAYLLRGRKHLVLALSSRLVRTGRLALLHRMRTRPRARQRVLHLVPVRTAVRPCASAMLAVRTRFAQAGQRKPAVCAVRGAPPPSLARRRIAMHALPAANGDAQ